MTAPKVHQVLLQPPRHNMTPEERYKFDYEMWQRTGRFTQVTPDLKGLQVNATQLNTLIDIRTDETVQEQINLKASSASLGTMAIQNSNSVAITGGTVIGTAITSSSITRSQITLPVNSTVLDINLNGTLHVDTTAVGNIGTGEDNLIVYTMPQDVLGFNSQYLEITAWGTLAANANVKQLKLKLGSTILVDSGAVAANGGSWNIKTTIIRTSQTTQQAISVLLATQFSFIKTSTYVDVTEDLATSLDILCTGQAIANDDIIQKGLIIKWFRE